MNRTLILGAALLALACNQRTDEKKKNPGSGGYSGTGGSQRPGATPGKGTAPTPAPAPAPANKGQGDPEEGNFTLEEALAGLTGTGTLTATIDTSMGAIECALRPDLAPNTVANFVGLARGTRASYDFSAGQWENKPFYEGLTFHRVIPDFMIQGGDPMGTGTGYPGYKIPDEFSQTVLFDKPGRLAMAHSAAPNSAGSQFFITEAPYPSLDKKYAIFGECKNLDVVRKITRVPKTPGRPERPADPVLINSVTISYK